MFTSYISTIRSPLGDMLMVTDDKLRIRALDFADHRAHLHRLLREHYASYELVEAPAPTLLAESLSRYFEGDLTALCDIVTETAGTDLQRQVWTALRSIPAGQTMSYGALARQLGLTDPRAAIDVGAANGANPIAIMVPCHRVIATNGDLKGYAWGLHRKRWLLEHEKALVSASQAEATSRLPGF